MPKFLNCFLTAVICSSSVLTSIYASVLPSFPYGTKKVRGVNLGGWLVLEVLKLPCSPLLTNYWQEMYSSALDHTIHFWRYWWQSNYRWIYFWSISRLWYSFGHIDEPLGYLDNWIRFCSNCCRRVSFLSLAACYSMSLMSADSIMYGSQSDIGHLTS